MATFNRCGLFALGAAALSLTGCAQLFGENSTSTTEGTALGTYAVTATQTSNTCGAGALGSTALWSFSVEIAEAPGVFYWNNGSTVITGALAGDNESFSFDNQTTEDLQAEATSEGPPCSVTEDNQGVGTLSSSTTDVPTFSGSLSYQYAPTSGSQCIAFTSGTSPTFAALPCEFVYSFTASRTALAN